MNEPEKRGIEIYYEIGNLAYATDELVLRVIVGQPLVITDLELSDRLVDNGFSLFLDANASKSAFLRPMPKNKSEPDYSLATIEAHKEGVGKLLIMEKGKNVVLAEVSLIIYNPYSS